MMYHCVEMQKCDVLIWGHWVSRGYSKKSTQFVCRELKLVNTLKFAIFAYYYSNWLFSAGSTCRQNEHAKKLGHEWRVRGRKSRTVMLGGTCNLLTEHRVMRRWSKRERGERVQRGGSDERKMVTVEKGKDEGTDHWVLVWHEKRPSEPPDWSAPVYVKAEFGGREPPISFSWLWLNPAANKKRHQG